MKRIIILCFILCFAILGACAKSTPRWAKRPIKVYISQDSFKKPLMQAAFQEWQTKTFSAVWFIFLGENKQKEADITVYFPKRVNCGDPSSVGCTHFNTENGYYFKNIIEIGSEYDVKLKNSNGETVTKTIELPKESFYGIMLHEIGHSIGITEHSDNMQSVMFGYTLYDHNIPQHLTEEDLKLVYKIYR